MSFGVKLMTGAMRLLALQPLKMHYFWSGMFRWILDDIAHYRRDITMINLSRAFPYKKYKELSDIADRSYAHLADIFAEMVWFARSYNHKRLHEQHIFEVTNPEILNELFDNTPSVMILNSHRGNWEFTGGILQYFYGVQPHFEEKDMAVIYKELRSKFWDGVIAANRCCSVLDPEAECYIESKRIMRFAIENRNNKKLYIFPTDQSPYANSTVHNVDDFMHQSTISMLGGAALAHKFGMSAVYMSTDIESRGHYKVTFKEICRDAKLISPEEIMNSYYRMLEQDLDRQPWNYLWTHKRWK